MKRVFLTIFAVFIFIFNPLNLPATLHNKIVAVVGDEILTLYELDQMLASYLKQLEGKSLSAEEKNKLKDKLRKELLDQWVEDTLIGLEAKKYGIKVTDEELQTFIKENLGTASQEITSEEKEKIRDRLRKIKFIQIIVRERIVIPESEIKKAYEDYVKKHDSIPKYKLEVLLLMDKQKAEEIYDLALKGKTFKELAQQNLEGIQYLAETFKESELDRALLEEIKNLKPGEILPPKKRGEQYQIIKLLKKEEEIPSYEEIKKELYEELFQQKAKEFLEKWIKELKESKFIKIYL
ncbi:MAG: SurA N-terminal domain-containing protein [Caldimicrobium sp.]